MVEIREKVQLFLSDKCSFKMKSMKSRDIKRKNK